MAAPVRELFREFVDVPVEDRQRIFVERQLPTCVWTELESLLGYDSGSGHSLTGGISDAMQEALRHGRAPSPRLCGPYRLGHLLGAGGMGAVYLAERHDGEIEHKVAIKLLRADGDRPAWRERFLRERQLLARLNHPSIARLLDAGHTADGQPYLVMEHIQGVSIDEYSQSLDFPAKLKLFLLVCDGVSHAHRNLIVHRDLKPSNILVDSSGHPKLLDFGIAKLLDSTANQTRTMERLLTPDYASPEQLRGDLQTTATDIYSLGAVLYRLLTGRSPREALPESPLDQRDPAEPSQPLNRELPRDINHILQMALHHEASERYPSVDAFADDIRAFLEWRPVKARSGNAWYKTRRFLRRYRLIAAAVMITAAGLLTGLNVASHQRAIAQARMKQVRQLTNQVLSLEQVSGGSHNSSKSLHEIVATSRESLDPLIAEARTDKDLALELAEAYSLLARAEGICMAAGIEQHLQAAESLDKADHLLEPVLRANPNRPKALLTAARISHDRMTLAGNENRRDEALANARMTAEYVEKFFALGALSAAETEEISEFLYDVALSLKNLHVAGDGIRYARRSIEISRLLPNAQIRVSLGLSMLADLLRLTGDLEGALTAIRESRSILESTRFASDTERRSSLSRVLGREGKILGAAGMISLNRPAEAIVVLQRAFDLVEEWTQNDQEDAWSRLLFVSLGRELGDTLTLHHPKRALAVYDHALVRLREIPNHAEARRGEAELLAGSTYALRRLNRHREAQDRINDAFRLLGETGDYPAERVTFHNAVYEALSALGDHLSATGQSQQALKVYEDLFDKVMVSKPDAPNDLPHALALSQMYGSMAALYRSNGRTDRYHAVAALRLEVWRHWDSKLRGNRFIRRQLDAARHS